MIPMLSVIIINHDTPELTLKTIASAHAAAKSTAHEIILVDNSVRAPAPHEAADVYIKVENRGFAHACNSGARKASGSFLLFLNSDVILPAEAVDQAMACFCAHDGTGILGMRAVLPDGSLDKGCKRGLPTPWASFCYFAKLDRLFPKSRTFGRYHLTYLPDDRTQEIECASGAFLLMPADLFWELDGFDEAFFMYGEDLDLCVRTRMLGKAILYFADATLIHDKGGSSGGGNPRLVRAFYDAMLLFYDKHFAAAYPWLVGRMVRCAVYVKRTWALRRCEQG